MQMHTKTDKGTRVEGTHQTPPPGDQKLSPTKTGHITNNKMEDRHAKQGKLGKTGKLEHNASHLN